MQTTLRLRIRALIVWSFLSFVLLVWNRGFHPIMWWTWAAYRDAHPDKLAFSLLLFGVMTYLCLESLLGGTPGSPVSFDAAFRSSLLVLATVFLWMLWNLPGRTFSLSLEGPVMVDGSLAVDGSNNVLSDPIKVEIQR